MALVLEWGGVVDGGGDALESGLNPGLGLESRSLSGYIGVEGGVGARVGVSVGIGVAVGVGGGLGLGFQVRVGVRLQVGVGQGAHRVRE